ncbi:hypothetical protein [Mycolicibacterium sp. J2]|uniref:hypothetical protein n=1 Tax=Mycolicibacterium sp. J2 TaxID=2993511 RepID=UPI00224A55F7|nr:hypothetical protein [Mycolicibacterium sp. J2]MCX2714992.1 hypothetical protein [Mycolicibacterium sp. J2]
MFRIDGINGESIVIDGVWVEKLRANNSIGRKPADKYSGTDIKELSRRKKLFGGESWRRRSSPRGLPDRGAVRRGCHGRKRVAGHRQVGSDVLAGLKNGHARSGELRDTPLSICTHKSGQRRIRYLTPATCANAR